MANLSSKKTPMKLATVRKAAPRRGEAEKAGPGVPSASPLPGLAGAGLPSGGAAPAPKSERMNARTDTGRAHEQAGMTGAHAMEVPGMPATQGGNRNPNRVTSSGGRAANSTPEPHNRDNNAEPTNPRYQPDPQRGNGSDGRYPDAEPGMPPSARTLTTPDPMHPTGRVPNNPRGETTVPTERAPRPRMY